MSDAKIKFYCKKCGQKLGAEEEWVGMVTYCPNCNESVVVPFETEQNEPQVMRIHTTDVKVEDKPLDDKPVEHENDNVAGKIKVFLRAMLLFIVAFHALWLFKGAYIMARGCDAGFYRFCYGLLSLAVSSLLYGFCNSLFAVLLGIYENMKKCDQSA